MRFWIMASVNPLRATYLIKRPISVFHWRISRRFIVFIRKLNMRSVMIVRRRKLLEEGALTHV